MSAHQGTSLLTIVSHVTESEAVDDLYNLEKAEAVVDRSDVVARYVMLVPDHIPMGTRFPMPSQTPRAYARFLKIDSS
jgi:hypothetical protein